MSVSPSEAAVVPPSTSWTWRSARVCPVVVGQDDMPVVGRGGDVDRAGAVDRLDHVVDVLGVGEIDHGAGAAAVGDANFAGRETLSAVDVGEADALVDRVAVTESERSSAQGRAWRFGSRSSAIAGSGPFARAYIGRCPRSACRSRWPTGALESLLVAVWLPQVDACPKVCVMSCTLSSRAESWRDGRLLVREGRIRVRQGGNGLRVDRHQLGDRSRDIDPRTQPGTGGNYSHSQTPEAAGV